MICLKTVVVVVALAFWPPSTSHTLLESAGVIHTDDSQHDDDQDAAEGRISDNRSKPDSGMQTLHEETEETESWELMR